MQQTKNNKNIVESLYREVSAFVRKTDSRCTHADVIAILLVGLLMKSKNIDAEELLDPRDTIRKEVKDAQLASFLIDSVAKFDKYALFKVFDIILKYSNDVITECILSSNIVESTPEAISTLAIDILNIQENEEVADFYAGYGSVMFKMAKACPKAHCVGYDINSDMIIVSKIRSFVNGCDCGIENFNLIEGMPPKRFDKIYAEPPFGMRFGERELMEMSYVYGKKYPITFKNSEWLFILPVLNSLKSNGLATMVMPVGSAFNLRDKAIRNYLVSNGYIKAVIEMPSLMYNMTGVPVIIYVIGHNNTSIKFIDASTYGIKQNRVNVFDSETIKTLVSMVDDNSESGAMRLVTCSQVLQNENISLSPATYLEDNLTTFKCGTSKLSDCSRISRGTNIRLSDLEHFCTTEETDILFINVSDIKDGVVNQKKYLKETPETHNLPFIKGRKVVLFSKVWSPMKSAVIEMKETQKLVLGGNLYAIVPDENKLDAYYIQSFVECDNGKFIKPLLNGAVIRTISIEDLRKLEIPYPDLKIQSSIAKEFTKLANNVTEAKSKLNEAIEAMNKSNLFSNI